jgi:hypothetical protein
MKNLSLFSLLGFMVVLFGVLLVTYFWRNAEERSAALSAELKSARADVARWRKSALLGEQRRRAEKSTREKTAKGADSKTSAGAVVTNIPTVEPNKKRIETFEYLIERLKIRAATDPAGAANEAAALMDKKWRDRAVDEVMNVWVGAAPMVAADWVMKTQSGMAREALVYPLAIMWAKKDGVAAAAWALDISDGELRRSLLHWIFETAIPLQRKDITDWAERLPEGLERMRAVYGIADVWGYQALLPATDWARNLPPGQSREEAYKNLVGKWMQAGQPIEASQLLQAIPRESRDVGMIASVAEGFFRKGDSSSATAWLDTIPSEWWMESWNVQVDHSCWYQNDLVRCISAW